MNAIDVSRVDEAINLSVQAISEQISKIRAKVRKGEELTQAEIRLPASCAASLAAIRRMLSDAGVDAGMSEIDREVLKRGRDELDSYVRGGDFAVRA